MADFKQIWNGTKGFEGGYQQLVNDAANYCPAKGKAGSALIGTKFGISAIAWSDYFHRCPSVQDIKNMTPETAQQIAKAKFWDAVQGDKIKSQPVAHLVFDSKYGSGSYGPLHTRMAINKIMGKDTVPEFKSMKLSDDEVNKINAIPATKFFNTLMEIRKNFFKGLEYEKGYMNRMQKLAAMYVGVLSAPEKMVIKHGAKIAIGLTLIAVVVGIIVIVVNDKKK